LDRAAEAARLTPVDTKAMLLSLVAAHTPDTGKATALLGEAIQASDGFAFGGAAWPLAVGLDRLPERDAQWFGEVDLVRAITVYAPGESLPRAALGLPPNRARLTLERWLAQRSAGSRTGAPVEDALACWAMCPLDYDAAVTMAARQSSVGQRCAMATSLLRYAAASPSERRHWALGEP
jgi:hypothetical protein